MVLIFINTIRYDLGFAQRFEKDREGESLP